MQCLVFTDTDLYSLTKGKSYLAKQKWRRSTCLRDQCYDVGCHPCVPVFRIIRRRVEAASMKLYPGCKTACLSRT